MVLAGRRRTIAFFIALGAGLVSVILLLYIGWGLLNWRTGAHAHLAESVWTSDSVRQSLISVAEKTLLNPESRAYISRSTTCLQATTDTSDQTGASLPCCPLKLFSPDSEPARMKHRTRYRRGPSTNDIHCADLHRTPCIVPDYRPDR